MPVPHSAAASPAGVDHPSYASAMSPALVVLVLAMLLGIQPVTTDLYLPALPALTESFGATVSQAQLTLTTLLLAFGTSLANDVWFWSTCIALASFTLVQRYGEPRG